MATTRRAVSSAILALLAVGSARAEDFAAVVRRAKGGKVYFNAWGGSVQINDYIAWAGQRLRAEHGIELVHVKLAETAEAVGRILAEKAAGRIDGGSIDLIWINGENFRSLKEKNLLFGPFAGRLPSFSLVDTVGKPTTLRDFTVPTDGFESPWGMAQFVLLHDSARLPQPPRSLAALQKWILADPGRFTFPAPPDFIGTTFLKHLLMLTMPDSASAGRPADPAQLDAQAGGVWRWLDACRASFWRGGRTYPRNKEALHQLLDDNEVDISMAFNPSEASSLILAGRLPETVRSFTLEGGTIGNTHFLAIPFNANAKDAAMVVAEFLLSPEAQARKQDEAHWGDPTVLDLARLSPVDRARFDGLRNGPATLGPTELSPVREEPHPSWMVLLERGWAERYAG